MSYMSGHRRSPITPKPIIPDPQCGNPTAGRRGRAETACGAGSLDPASSGDVWSLLRPGTTSKRHRIQRLSPPTNRGDVMLKIENGQHMPTIEADMKGETVDVSRVTAGSWTALLLYRGHW